jgi:hypothetical protein
VRQGYRTPIDRESKRISLAERRHAACFTGVSKPQTCRGKETSMTFRTLVRPLFVALSLAFATTAAAPAFADGPDTKPAPAKEEKAKGDKAKGEHAKGEGKRGHAKTRRLGALEKFPMTSDKFEKIVDGRITHMKSKVETAMKKHNVPDADKAKVMKEVDDGAALIRAAAKKAGADGQVTKAEAMEVQALAKKLREQIHAKLTANKSAAAKDI